MCKLCKYGHEPRYKFNMETEHESEEVRSYAWILTELYQSHPITLYCTSCTIESLGPCWSLSLVIDYYCHHDMISLITVIVFNMSC